MVRRSTIAMVLGAALAISVFLPTVAAGDPVGDLLGGVGSVAGVGGGGAGGGAEKPVGTADNRAGTPPNYNPPLHGTNPHGEGTVASVDLNPSDSNPYPGSPQSGNEEIVVGDSRGEQNGGGYHGRVTLLYLNPLGIPIANIFIETNPGESRKGPPPPLDFIAQANAGPLSNLCTSSGGNVCIQVLPMDSSTSTFDSSNSFAIFRGYFMQGQTTLNLGTSNGQIQEAGGCQTASGGSSIANGTVAGLGNFDVLSASSSSTACNDGSQSTQNSSSFINLFGVNPLAGVPVLGPFFAACGNMVANSSFVLGPLGLVCNANDVNGGQTSNPYGVREALTAFVTVLGNTVKVTLSGPESHAVAPPTVPGGQVAPAKKGGKNGPNQGEAGGEGAGAVAGEAASGGELAFTGEDVLLLGLIGTGLFGLGLLIAAGTRRLTA